MKAQDIQIVGVCRFAMLGRGDWKAYRGKPEHELTAIYEEKAKELFARKRIERRLATFEHLTLGSMRNQTDPNFRFLVVSSDRMPATYRKRLEMLCAETEQVVLRFVPPMHVSDTMHQFFAEFEMNMADIVQFRLDDDDCVAKDYIRRLRRHAAGMWRNANFAVSFPSIYYCVTSGPTGGVYDWYSPFFSAGTAIRHNTRTVFDFGHYKIPQHLVAATDPHFPCVVTHAGDNDTPRHEAAILRKRGMSKADPGRVLRDLGRHFDFLSGKGRKLATLPKHTRESAREDA